MHLFLHLIRALFAVFLDALAFIHLCLRPAAAVAAEISFCANNSAFLPSVTSNHDGPPIRSDSLSPDYPAGLIGGMPLLLSNPTR
jgi:hypothetical protein